MIRELRMVTTKHLVCILWDEDIEPRVFTRPFNGDETMLGKLFDMPFGLPEDIMDEWDQIEETTFRILMKSFNPSRKRRKGK